MNGLRRGRSSHGGKRLLIVDQSLRSFQGHHFEYDVSIAEAAAREGWEPIILAHKSLSRRTRPAGVRVIRTFRVSWYGRVGGRLRTFADRFIRPLSPYRIATSVANSVVLPLIRYVRRVVFVRFPSSRTRGALSRSRKIARLYVNTFGRVGRWLSRPWKVVIRAAVPVLALLLWPFLLIAALRPRREKRPFAKDLRRALAAVKAGGGDMVFVHTLHVGELEQLLMLLTVSRKDDLPTFHLLLRRDCNEDLVAKARGLGLKTCLERFHASGLYPRHVRFYTDTDRLTAQYDAVSPIRFTTLAIPFRHELIDRLAASARRDDGGPKHVVYLGDARPEKGYLYLPDMVAGLWQDYAEGGKARFTIQSNFNLPGGEPGAKEARRRLAQFPGDIVDLLMEPLTPEDYYRLLAEADIVVLPYDAERYVARSSGVLAEAISAGKVAVVPEGTWMADQIDPSRGRTFAKPLELSAAVASSIDDFHNLSKEARKYVATWRRRQSPAALVSILLENHAQMRLDGAEPADAAKTILYIMDADAFINKTGSREVALGQLDFMRRCNYRVFAVLPLMDLLGWEYELSRYEKWTLEAISELGFAGVWVLHWATTFRRPVSILRAMASLLKNKRSLKNELLIRRGFVVSASLRKFVKNNPIDAVFLNYITNINLLGAIGVDPNIPVICEMHDIQSHQFAIWGNRDIDEMEFATECSLLDRCATVIPITELEEKKITPYLTKAAIHHVPCCLRTRPAAVTALTGCCDLAEVVSAGDSNLPEVDLDAAYKPSRNRSQIERLQNTENLDLLFVSTAHIPNVLSFRWFYNEVFLPYLGPEGVSVIVAGNIYLNLRDLSHSKLFFAGRQDNLDPLYAASRVVILPITCGAGFSIKTLEALGKAKPVVATSLALRGFGSHNTNFATYDTVEAFAERVFELLEDPEERAATARKGYEIFKRANDAARFDEAMTGAFRSTLGDGVQPQPSFMDDDLMVEPPFVEWSVAFRDLNALMRAYAYHLRQNRREKRPLVPDPWMRLSLSRILKAAADEDRRPSLEALYQAWMVERTAPLFENVPWTKELAECVKQAPDFDGFLAMISDSFENVEDDVTILGKRDDASKITEFISPNTKER